MRVICIRMDDSLCYIPEIKPGKAGIEIGKEGIFETNISKNLMAWLYIQSFNKIL